ncbi:hypothetical protein K439DRAFT_1621105 [Ramaria rubella]|nr:hypothetical protein K439DRAFT_1621105 [Ramaria rubella]
MDLKDQRYADVATQTSPLLSPVVSSCSSNSVPNFPNDTSLLIPPRSRPEGLLKEDDRLTTENGSSPAYCQLEIIPHQLSYSSSLNAQRCPGSRPPPSCNRTVSLPETLCDEDLRLVLSQLIDKSIPEVKQQRVVSMPEPMHLAHCPSTADTGARRGLNGPPQKMIIDAGTDVDTYCEDLHSNSSSPSTPRTVVVHSLSSDQFHTPSPPSSSCDSVEFTLDDPAHLSGSFLRGSTSSPIFIPVAINKTADLLEDEGWLTWANSPPRPIPALHGPSSLPYARCPSGAEGTIIGEPSSLPRMIWGLDPNDVVSTSHFSQPQQPRPMPIKCPGGDLQLRYGGVQGLNPTASIPSTLTPLNVGPRFGHSDTDCSFFEDSHAGFLPSNSVHAFGPRREGTVNNGIHGMARSSTGLGLHAKEEISRSKSRSERERRDEAIMEPSRIHRMHTANSVDRDVGMPPVESEALFSAEAQTAEKSYRRPIHALRREHPSNLIELQLLSSPVRLLDSVHSHIASVTPRISAPEFKPNYLPTPPNSSSPQWCSLLSPLRSNHPPLQSSSHDNDFSLSVGTRHQPDTTIDELSDELRRFVFENMSPTNSLVNNSHDSQIPLVRLDAPLTARNALPFPVTPAHPPGLPIPQHILLSKALEPFDPLSTNDTSSPAAVPFSAAPYTRSTLLNPRSVPLSRLRQKRGTIKLATVPEEDTSEPHVHDGRLAPKIYAAPRLSFRTPSPLDNTLHAQSMEDKTTFGEEFKLAKVRVKLPHGSRSHTDSVQSQRPNGELGHSRAPEGSPKKRRLQRRKRPLKVEADELGFPLVSESNVSFHSGSLSAAQISKEASKSLAACTPSASLETFVEAMMDKQNTSVRGRARNVTI